MKWLESVAKGDSQAYPQREALKEDAASFLARWDRARSEYRGLGERYRELVTGVANLTELPPRSSSEALLESLARKLESNTESEPDRTPELQEKLDDTRAKLQQAQSELERTRKEITTLQTELKREQRRLEPVVRYAYNLRRLVQKVHATGKVTPGLLGHIEKLLKAGGVPTQSHDKQAAGTSNAHPPKTPHQQRL